MKYQAVMYNRFLFQRLRRSVQPNMTWGPALNEDRVRAGYSKIERHDKDGILKSDYDEKNDQESTYIELATTEYNSFK